MNRMGNYIVAQYENALITSNGHNSFYIAVHNMKEPNLNYYRTPENELDPAQPENYFDQMDPIECNYQIRHVANGLYQIKVRRVHIQENAVTDNTLNFETVLEPNEIQILRAKHCFFRADGIYCNHQQERRWLYGWLYYKHQYPHGFRPESAG